MRSGKGREGFGAALQQSAVPFFYSSAVPRPWKRREHPHRNAPAFMPFSQTGSPSGSRRASLLEDVSDADVAAPVFDHLARIDAFKVDINVGTGVRLKFAPRPNSYQVPPRSSSTTRVHWIILNNLRWTDFVSPA